MENIQFFAEEIEFELGDQAEISTWINYAIKHFKKDLEDLSFIFCSDNYLLKINQDYLSHDDYTDIITFDYSEDESIEGEIYISIDRVEDNARKFGVSFEQELRRVIIHGVLHLLGFKDKTDVQKQEMREKEDHFLNLYA